MTCIIDTLRSGSVQALFVRGTLHAKADRLVTDVSSFLCCFAIGVLGTACTFATYGITDGELLCDAAGVVSTLTFAILASVSPKVTAHTAACALFGIGGDALVLVTKHTAKL